MYKVWIVLAKNWLFKLFGQIFQNKKLIKTKQKKTKNKRKEKKTKQKQKH